jgi:ribonuclease HII
MNQDPYISNLISRHERPAFMDSVGSGAILGPIVACAVMIPKDLCPPLANWKIDDSKKLRHNVIYALAPILKENMVYSIGISEIDEICTFKSTFKADKMAMLRAVQGFKEAPDALFVDGDKKYAPRVCPTEYTIVKGDAKVRGIAIASIIAKDYRDHLIIERYGREYSHYDVCSNKGYRSPTHLRAIRKWGITPFHREYMSLLQHIIKESL